MSAPESTAIGPTASRRATATIAAGLGLLLAAVMLAFAPMSPASAAPGPAPTTPAAAFSITCPGTTTLDPSDGDTVVADLTRVSGQRLANYNAGHAVPLYDFYGANAEPYPPLCGVHYDETTGGPVAEWMFCTDLTAKVCGETNAAGELIEAHYTNGVKTSETAVGPMGSEVGNERLTSEQNRIIAYLIRNGHDYSGVGSQAWGGATDAAANSNSDERAALQTLIWCVSDTPSSSSGNGFFETCQANMSTAEMDRILALTPENPALTLNFDSTTQTIAAGDTARVTLSTNVYEQPIALTATPAGAVAVCADGGNATITGTTLTAHGSSSSATSYTLCLTSTDAGPVTITASATPASTEHINWNQSAVLGNTVICQHFASFDINRAEPLSNAAAVNFAAKPTTTPTPEVPVVPEQPVTPIAEQPVAPVPTPTAVPSTPAAPSNVSATTSSPQLLASTGVELTVTFIVSIAAIVLGTLGMLLMPRRRRNHLASRASRTPRQQS